jgi:hypothetical protein
MIDSVDSDSISDLEHEVSNTIEMKSIDEPSPEFLKEEKKTKKLSKRKKSTLRIAHFMKFVSIILFILW